MWAGGRACARPAWLMRGRGGIRDPSGGGWLSPAPSHSHRSLVDVGVVGPEPPPAGRRSLLGFGRRRVKGPPRPGRSRRAEPTGGTERGLASFTMDRSSVTYPLRTMEAHETNSGPAPISKQRHLKQHPRRPPTERPMTNPGDLHSPVLQSGFNFSAKFRFFFVFASYRDPKFRYFSIYFISKFNIQQISSEIHRNSPKFIEIPERNSVSADHRDSTGKRNGEPCCRVQTNPNVTLIFCQLMLIFKKKKILSAQRSKLQTVVSLCYY